MATCTYCGSSFRLCLDFNGKLEGVLMEGQLVCTACIEVVAREIERGAQPKETVHR